MNQYGPILYKTNLNLNNHQPIYNTFKYNIPKSMKKNKICSNTLYTNYSLFNNDYYFNNNYIEGAKRINNIQDFNNINNKHSNKSLEQDLDMIKIQLRCDLISQKIYQIQDHVKHLRDSSI